MGTGKRDRPPLLGSADDSVLSKRPPLRGATQGEFIIPTNTIELDGKTCTHQVYHPPIGPDTKNPLSGVRYAVSSAPPQPFQGKPAREYSFRLDPFQQTAIRSLEAGHNVLVAAHTSAGKTVVAEYAFGMALRDGGRVVYTSPLKALSNQKYRELREEFKDVGLMTGDVTINPTASCLVMTTEILRSMLYNGSEVVREVQLLVYDEIHYMRDKERGVVWEESIILAPKSARFAFLSATIPNAGEFAGWIAKTHGSSCDVVYTDFRPTPLQHFIYPVGGTSIYMVVDEKSTFREDAFQTAAAVVAGTNAASASQVTGRKESRKEAGTGESSDIFKLVKMVLERNLDPVIIFSFSKSEVESLSTQMASMDLNNEAEKTLTESVFRCAMDCLGDEDRKLPQINEALPMLKRGIGVHHSGLLPIVKEVIELLFQEGLVKVLFATETFSTGLNMPAKTVIFSSVRKFDGSGFRNVSSGEYIQMSGRAGRRGLDDRGVVVLMMDSHLEPAAAKELLHGAPDALNSEFHLGYNMLLNLSCMSDTHSAEDLLRRSFRQFQADQALPKLQQQLADLEAERDRIRIDDEEAVAEILLIMRKVAALQDGIRKILTIPKHILPFLQPGRLVRIIKCDNKLVRFASPETDNNGRTVTCTPAMAWGIFVNFERHGGTEACKEKTSKKNAASFLIDVLINHATPKLTGELGPSDVPKIISMELSCLDAVSSVRVFIPKELQTTEAKTVAARTLAEVMKRFPQAFRSL